MARVVAPLRVKVEAIGRPRESGYEPGTFYYPTLFIDLSQPDSEASKIWKNLTADEVSQIQKGDIVQLVEVGRDKSGKPKHNILLDAQTSVATPNTPALQTSGWSPEEKRAIASKVQQHADLLRYCLETSRSKFDGLVESEESFRTLATTLYLSTLRESR